MRTPVPFVPEVTLDLAAEAIEALWERTGGTEPPFWAYAWPGGQGLARYVLDTPAAVAGRDVLDLATGSGLVAIAAALAGAGSVAAVDVDPAALVAVRRNAETNGVAVKDIHGDVTGEPPWADTVLAGDVFYDRDMTARILPYLRAAAAHGATVLVGDPGREYRPREGLTAVARHAVPVDPALEGRSVCDVTIWRVGAHT